MPTKNLTFRCPADLADALKAHGTATGNDRTLIILQALRQYLAVPDAGPAAQEGEPAGVLAALAARLAQVEADTAARLDEMQSQLDAAYADLAAYDERLNTHEREIVALREGEATVSTVTPMPPSPPATATRKTPAATQPPAPKAPPRTPEPEQETPGTPNPRTGHDDWLPLTKAFRRLLREQGLDAKGEVTTAHARALKGHHGLTLATFGDLSDEEYQQYGFEVRPNRETTTGPYLRWSGDQAN